MRRKKTLWGVISAVSAAVLIACLILLLQPKEQAQVVPKEETEISDVAQSDSDVTRSDSSETRQGGAASDASEDVAVPSGSAGSGGSDVSGSAGEQSIQQTQQIQQISIPVDFEQLQAENPDVIAWLRFPGTTADYPIYRREGEDDYYLRRDGDGKDSIAGELYIQASYNASDFSDPVTVIYGHNMDDGSMLGGLQPYCETIALDETDVFYLYQPERRLTYRVFAAVPYDNSHILYYNDFTTETGYDQFFRLIYSTRDLHANLNRELIPSFGDRVVILSTCLNGDNSSRFLVMGVLTEDAGTASQGA